jgi:hypothetical protein
MDDLNTFIHTVIHLFNDYVHCCGLITTSYHIMVINIKDIMPLIKIVRVYLSRLTISKVLIC